MNLCELLQWDKELINNEINRKVKNNSINKNDLTMYFKVEKILCEAGKNYGKPIIKEYSKKLTSEFDYATSIIILMII